MKPIVPMREALTHPSLLGGALEGESWLPWRVLLIAAVGEPLTDEERGIFTTLTERESEPLEPVDEFWAVAGRRSGKTRAAGALAAYVAGLCDHGDYLAPGERAVLPILAASVSQAGRAFMHARAIIEHSPELVELMEGEPTSDTIRLSSRVDIEVRPANFRTVRSITAVAAIADEVAFWQIESTSNPDTEILNALRPALATTGGPLWVISSPYAKRGELYETYRRDFGEKGDRLVMVAKAASRTLNSTLSQRVVDRAYARDAAVAAAEYGAEFRSDIEQFVSRETVESCVSTGVASRPPASGIKYLAFTDPSGGGADSFTLAIAHEEKNRAVIDLLLERRPPFSPESVVSEFAETLKAYGVHEVVGDRYAGEFPREAFRRHGIAYRLSEQPKSGLYQSMLPLLNSSRLDLLDAPNVVTQIASLERRVARGGRESIDHPPHGHDDIANVIAGVATLCIRRSTPPVAQFGTYGAASAQAGASYELPPPEWVRSPRSEDQRAAAQSYLARRRTFT